MARTATIARKSASIVSLVAPAPVTAAPAPKGKAPAPKAPAPHAMKGKLAVLRNAAMAGVASLAYAEGKARADTLVQLAIALGPKPTDADVEALKLEYIVGRVAFKLADNSKSIADQIAHARDVVTRYAAPPKEGTTARALRAGQLGRRTVEQHKAVRASEEAWSQIKADLGIGSAQTSDVRKASKGKTRAPRATNANAVSAPTAGQGVTHSELVKTDGPMTADAACAYLVNMAATMNMFAKKHAGVLPSTFGASVVRFYGAIDQAAKDREANRKTEA